MTSGETPRTPPRESAAWVSDDEDRPGDPACLLRRVCPACGAVAREDPPTVCPECHRPITGD